MSSSSSSSSPFTPPSAALQPPTHSDQILVSFPSPHVLLLTLNRPRVLNAMTPQMEDDIVRVLDWFDAEPSLWVIVVTGAGRIFCAGADLIAWGESQNAGIDSIPRGMISSPHGFGGISRRRVSSKPMIAAVSGGSFGGGTEMVLNCDLVVAGAGAKIALPEVRRGVCAVQGAIPRIAKIAGHQLASEMLLLGRTITAQEAHSRFGFVNFVVPDDSVLPRALALAAELSEVCSPDAVQATKRALVLAAQGAGAEEVVRAHAASGELRRLDKSDNIKEGLRAFAEKRKPVWSNPAKL